MLLKNKTVLITGGSSGIGLELARQLIQQENTVLVCGRSLNKLEQAKRELPNLHIFQCDLAESAQRENLISWVKTEHSDMSVLINNAALAHQGGFLATTDAMELAEKEVAINFLAPLHLTHALAPLLHQNAQPTIINITTGLVYAPLAKYSYYNATKAALHSFTQGLRLQESKNEATIIEVLMPVVNTPWHKGKAPKSAISPARAVGEMLRGIAGGKTEIRVGLTRLLWLVSRLSPALGIKLVNRQS